MRTHIRSRRRWEALAAASALLTTSLAFMTTAATPSAAADCARRYVAQGDGVPAGEDVANGVEYPTKLLNDHLKAMPGGTDTAPWCLWNTSVDRATTQTFVQGSGSQLSQASTYKPTLITLQVGRQNTKILDQIDSCFLDIQRYEIFPAAADCAQKILNDTTAWTNLQKDLGGILNTYKTQMAGNPNLIVAVLGYYNPYPSFIKVLPKIPRLCIPTADAAIPCMVWWYATLPPALSLLDQVVNKLNATIQPVVQQFTTASQGRFFWVPTYEKFKRHCTAMVVTLDLPLVFHGLYVDSHPVPPTPKNVGCSLISSWIAGQGGVPFPVPYLLPVAPPGIWLAPPIQATEAMGVNPNSDGHGCLSDLVWETVKNKLGVPEKADVNGACSRFTDLADLADTVLNPGPAGEQNANPPVAPVSAAAQGRVTAGSEHSCVVLAAKTVQCWGKNESGQLGNGTLDASTDPVTVSNVSNATQIAAGNDHTCALIADGTVRCWGSNTSGQLGAGGTTNSSTPVQVTGLSGVTALSAGASFTCALLSDATVKCWGDNSARQIGDGTSQNRAAPTVVTGITKPIVGISSGDYHTCALLADGTVSCWGADGSGQLGNGKVSDSPSGPTAVQGLPDPGVNPTVALAAGSGHTCALLKDNSARCWGANDSGQLGFETAADPETDGGFVPGGPGAVQYDSGSGQLHTLLGITALAAGTSHTCALMVDGSARCWGANFAGQLGRPAAADHEMGNSSSAIVVPGLTGASALAAGSGHNCAIVGTGVKCWGYEPVTPPVASRNRPAYVYGVSGANAVTAGTGFACALVDADMTNKLPAGTTNAPMCWGDNADGQVGAGAPAGDSNVRAVSGISSADAIDAGNGQVCAVPKGTTSVQCWGRNADGQVGNGTTTDQFAPVPVPGSVTTAISAGGTVDADGAVGVEHGHSCAVQTDTTVACWGRNNHGQLGDGTTTDRPSPVTVQMNTDTDPNHVANLTGVTSVVTGGSHSCALASDRTVWCWGQNDHGQLGDNSTVQQRTVATHVRTDDPNQDQPLGSVVALAAGADFTCAALPANSPPDHGEARCWGANTHGQLGVGMTVILDARRPVAVQGLPASVTAITAGDTHVCAALADDSLVCWGGNSQGQLGDGTSADSPSPEVILNTPPPVSPPAQPAEAPVIRSISASRANTCVTRFDKMVACWGDNSHGQLGNSGPGMSVTPIPVHLGGAV